jgi:hypothetical protein
MTMGKTTTPPESEVDSLSGLNGDMFGVSEGSCSSFTEADPFDEEKEVKEMTRKETTDVRVWRLVILAAMVGAATLVSTGTYIFLRKAEDDNFVDSVRHNFVDI